MSQEIPPTIEAAVRDILRQVKDGKLTLVQVGGSLTHLNFHPDFPTVLDPRLRTVIEDIAPDLEIENGDTRDTQELWDSIELLLREIFGTASVWRAYKEFS